MGDGKLKRDCMGVVTLFHFSYVLAQKALGEKLRARKNTSRYRDQMFMTREMSPRCVAIELLLPSTLATDGWVNDDGNKGICWRREAAAAALRKWRRKM